VFDDELFFTFNSKPNINAVQITGKNCQTSGYFKTLMQNDSLFSFHETNEKAIDYALLTNANIVILNELDNFSSGLISEINKYVLNGGHLIFIPSLKPDITSYSEFSKNLNLPIPANTDTSTMRLEKTNFKTGFYEGVFEKLDERMDLPVVRKHYTNQQSTKSNIVPILKLLNGETWLGELETGNSRIYCFSSSLDLSATNFCKHALFVPTIYKMAINSLKPTLSYFYTQNNSVISLNVLNEKSEEPFHITDLNKKSDVIPEMRLANNHVNFYTQNQITNPGFYILSHKENQIMPLAFNFNRLESGLDFYTSDDIEKLIVDNHLVSYKNLIAGEKPLTTSIQEIGGNTKLWKLFIILTLIFIALEIALIRFLK